MDVIEAARSLILASILADEGDLFRALWAHDFSIDPISTASLHADLRFERTILLASTAAHRQLHSSGGFPGAESNALLPVELQTSCERGALMRAHIGCCEPLILPIEYLSSGDSRKSIAESSNPVVPSSVHGSGLGLAPQSASVLGLPAETSS